MFEFAAPARVIFGSGSLEKLPEIVTGFGLRVLVVSGATGTRAEFGRESLRASGCEVETYLVRREPTVEDVQAGVSLARAHACDVVLGLGGGSALDAAKAIAAVVRAPGDLLDYLEVVGRGQALLSPGLPCVAVPTTAGTGSEVTRNAVIGVPSHATKVSLRGPHVLPRVALVDPRLTLSVPPDVTASTGFDALTQVIEPFFSTRRNPIADALAREGIRLASKSLRRAFLDGSDLAAREDMALASLLGGLCLANAGLGAVHGLAGPIGGAFHAPHGAICAALLAGTMQANLVAVRDGSGEDRDELLERFRELGCLLTEQVRATAEDGVDWLRDLTTELRIQGLSSLGLEESSFDALTAQSLRASSMRYNPVRLSAAALQGILRDSM